MFSRVKLTQRSRTQDKLALWGSDPMFVLGINIDDSFASRQPTRSAHASSSRGALTLQYIEKLR